MLIKVTQEHIDNGIREDCNKCPVALALCTVLQDKAIKVSVFKDQLYFQYYIDGYMKIKKIQTSVKTNIFISDFDEGNTKLT